MATPILEDPQLQSTPPDRRPMIRYLAGLSLRAAGYGLLWRWLEPGAWGRIIVVVFVVGEVVGLAWAAFTVLVVRKMVTKLQQAAAVAAERVEQGAAQRAADRDAIVVEPSQPTTSSPTGYLE
jgi:hypothetical protein